MGREIALKANTQKARTQKESCKEFLARQGFIAKRGGVSSGYPPYVYQASSLRFNSSTLKRIALILLLLSFVLGSLTADQVIWTWHCNDHVNYFRYKLNGQEAENWTVVDSSITNVQLQAHSGDVLYVQSSYDGVNWSTSGSGTYSQTTAVVTTPKTKRNALRLNLAPYSQARYLFYNGYNTASNRTKTQTVYGFAASLDYNIPLSTRLSLYPELCYNLVIKEDTNIPSARNVQYFKAGAGADLTFGITEKTTIYTGLFAGAMAHINNKKASITPYFGARLGFDRTLSERFSIGALSRVSLAFFTGRSSRLMDSMTILFDPVSITLSYRF